LQLFHDGAQVVLRGAAALSQQEKNSSTDLQRNKVSITGFIYIVAG
jgi:hypothetical protein